MILDGEKAIIYEFVNETGKSEVTEFQKTLNLSDRKKVVKLLEWMSKTGKILNTEKFVNERGPIFAFKSGQIRIYCFFMPDIIPKTIVLTNACIKKSRKASPAELEKAERIYREITRKGK
jgi:hypothetical protein